MLISTFLSLIGLLLLCRKQTACLPCPTLWSRVAVAFDKSVHIYLYQPVILHAGPPDCLSTHWQYIPSLWDRWSRADICILVRARTQLGGPYFPGRKRQREDWKEKHTNRVNPHFVSLLAFHMKSKGNNIADTTCMYTYALTKSCTQQHELHFYEPWNKWFWQSHEVVIQIDIEACHRSVMETLFLHLHISWRDVRGHLTS